MSCQDSEAFDDLLLNEQDIFSFDFASIGLASPPDSISNATIAITVIDGVDPNPADIKINGPTITGLIASVVLKGLVANVTYCLLMEVDASGGRKLKMPGRLRVVPPCS